MVPVNWWVIPSSICAIGSAMSAPTCAAWSRRSLRRWPITESKLGAFPSSLECGWAAVTSMAELGVHASLEEVSERLAGYFGRVFDCEILHEAAVFAGAERETELI